MTAAQSWIALRELYEGAPGTIARLAQAAGKAESTLSGRAEKEGWAEFDLLNSHRERTDRLATMTDWALREGERLVSGEEGAIPDKVRIEGVSSVLKLIEKIKDVTRREDGAKEEQIATDAEIAEVLGKINRRIVELAREFARRLV